MASDGLCWPLRASDDLSSRPKPTSALLRCGISMPIVEHRRWMGQWLGSPAERYSSEVVRFVFEERQIEAALAPLDVPGTCGLLMTSDCHGLPPIATDCQARAGH